MSDHPKSENNPKGAGRPYHKIDWNFVEQSLKYGADGVKIAEALGIHYDTLYHAVEREYGIKFSEYAAQKRSKGDILLHAKQFQEAMKGDRGMLIWLGKQRLGQRDYRNLSFDQNTPPTFTVINYADLDKESAKLSIEEK